MSGGEDDAGAPVTSTDVGYFTDADQLETGIPEPVPDPDVPPPADTVDAPADPLERTAVEDPETRRLLDAVGAALSHDAAAREALDRLARSGRVDEALGAALASLAGRPRAPALMLNGIDPWLILAQLVRHLDNPLRVSQGRGRGTCGAATMEYLLLRSCPAEVVRLVDGLTGIDQGATTRSGSSLELPPTAIARDDSRRVDVDRLFQSALMNRASTMSAVFDYDNTEDHDDFWSEIQGNSRVPLDGFARLYDDITGEAHRSISTGSIPASGLLTLLSLASKRGERTAVLVAFTGPTHLHWLAVEKVDPGPTVEGKRWVFLRNPWGHDDGQGPPPRWPLAEGGGRIAVEVEVFLELLRGAVVGRPG